jgi:hypothetical protein
MILELFAMIAINMKNLEKILENIQKLIAMSKRESKFNLLTLILLSIVIGLVLIILSQEKYFPTLLNTIFSSLGTGLIATGIISIGLEIFWSKERINIETEQLRPFLEEMDNFTKRLNTLEGRLTAFKQIGLNYCHSSREKALSNFYVFAIEMIKEFPETIDKKGDEHAVCIVSSSCRGLIGYLDRGAHTINKKWRELIINNHKYFRILLTHPAYAHLRQPAEERSSGDIELEIIKTTLYLFLIGNLRGAELRYYRGSPTVFLIRIENHILLNPYPYGQMAMKTLGLEFESESEESYIYSFSAMHFDHTWAFLDQDSKTVDEKGLVVGINNFSDILEAFSECTLLGNSRKLRLTENQVREIDRFYEKILKEVDKDKIKTLNLPASEPFNKFSQEEGLSFFDK